MKTRPDRTGDWHGGAVIRILVVLGILFVLGAILWVLLLPRITASMVHHRTGFVVKVDSMALNPFSANVAIKGLVLTNPAGWPSADFVDLREFRADANLFSLFGSRLLVREIVVDVAQVQLVRNREGTLNALAFQEGLAGKEETGTQAKGGTKREFMVKHMVLKFDKLVYADYSGRTPVTKTYNLNLNRDMRDVDSVKKIFSPFAGSALGLVSESLGGVFKADPNLIRDATGVLQEAGKKTGEKLKGLFDSLDKQKR